MLLDFFKFFGTDFNYEDLGISIRKGGFFFRKSERGWNGDNEYNSFRLCMENP